MKTRGDMLRFAIASSPSCGRASWCGDSAKDLSEDERYLIADDVVHRLQQHGGPWRLSEDLPKVAGRGFSTPPTNKA